MNEFAHVLTADVCDRLWSNAVSASPREYAGLLAITNDGQVLILETARETCTDNTFSLSPSLFLQARKQKATICAFFHSHPNGQAFLSAWDTSSMYMQGKPSWPGVAWCILPLAQKHMGKVLAYTWHPHGEVFQKTWYPV